MIWKRLIAKKDSRQGGFVVRTKEQKAKDGIEFTVKTYGKTLKDLARYDRGESFSR